MKLKGLVFLLALVVVLAQSGCGIISVLGTPRRHEKKITAEYNLAACTEKKILVLVEQRSWIDAGINLRYYVTGAINESLEKKVGILREYLVGYSELSEFRSKWSGLQRLSPTKIGAGLGADMVLLVTIEDYRLSEIAESGYLAGLLSGRAVLFETATKEKLWPVSAKSKSIKVGFDIEGDGREAANARLAAALAHCTTRYLYDCPEDRFKTADDRGSVGWKDWKN